MSPRGFHSSAIGSASCEWTLNGRHPQGISSVSSRQRGAPSCCAGLPVSSSAQCCLCRSRVSVWGQTEPRGYQTPISTGKIRCKGRRDKFTLGRRGQRHKGSTSPWIYWRAQGQPLQPRRPEPRGLCPSPRDLPQRSAAATLPFSLRFLSVLKARTSQRLHCSSRVLFPKHSCGNW